MNMDVLVQRAWWAYLLWLPALAILGFAVSFIFSDLLRLPRKIFLIPYILMTGLCVFLFVTWSGSPLGELIRHNWVWGVVGAVLLSAFLIRNVFSQPASERARGFPLALEILWSGVVYGLADALLLSVLPVLATWQAFSILGFTASWPGKIAVGAVAFIASLLVTICYHLGYREYRSRRGIFGPIIGNGVMTLGYLLTNNPISALFSHVAMHIAGVMRGPDSVVQLPPH